MVGLMVYVVGEGPEIESVSFDMQLNMVHPLAGAAANIPVKMNTGKIS